MARLRPIVRAALALCLAASTQGLLFVQGAFEVRQDWIVEVLCTNPDEACDGYCVLRDRMDAHHDHEDGPSGEAALQVALAVAPLVPETVRLGAPDGVPVTLGAPGLRVGATDGVPAGVFRPPRTA
ncbi:MAG: hypothetical protein AAF845_15800 [Bacteroidota bacterium]